jgi:uroporphyrinogen-III synthase
VKKPMTKEDIMRLAQEAGYHSFQFTSPSVLERFASLVAAAEREACAKVCEEAHWSLDDRHEYAALIRARGQA